MLVYKWLPTIRCSHTGSTLLRFYFARIFFLNFACKKQKPNERIFRRTVGYDITFSAETKKDLMEKFVMHLKNKARRQGAGAAQVDDITTESVSATIAKLNNAGKALCTHENGSERALMMFKFENVILWDMEESGEGFTTELY